MFEKIDRREMLSRMGKTGLALAGMSVLSGLGAYDEGSDAYAAAKSKVVISTKGTVQQRVQKAIDALGGIKKFVKKGAKVVIKPNAAWAQAPKVAATTHPLVVGALIAICKKAGAGSIIVIEHTCDNAAIAFKKNLMNYITKKHGVPMIDGKPGHNYRQVSVPGAKSMTKMNALKQVMDADCYINCPIVKVHRGAKVTLGLKNHMGCVEDRGFMHRNDLHQCIADAALVLKPNLVVLDATRILLTGGPRGPGKVKKPGQIIATTDIVAGDAYGVTLLGYKAGDIKHIVEAHRHGLGQMDMNKIQLVRV